MELLPYNAAVALARLGVNTTYISRVSRDMFGRMLIDHLEANQVDVSLIGRCDEPTTLAFVRQRDDGSPEYAFYSRGAADRGLRATDTPSELPRDLHGMLCGSISLVQEPSGTAIEELVTSAGVPIAFDPNIRPSLVTDEGAYRDRIIRLSALSTVVKLSDEDLEWLFPEVALFEGVGRLLGAGASLVVVTRGASGAEAHLGDRRIAVSAVEPAAGGDSVGAGDTFQAALVAWLVSHGLLADEAVPGLTDTQVGHMLRFATRAAAITCSRVGADPPTEEELAAE